MKTQMILKLFAVGVLIALESCAVKPGTPVTIRGYVRGSDGSKASIETTFVPDSKGK